MCDSQEIPCSIDMVLLIWDGKMKPIWDGVERWHGSLGDGVHSTLGYDVILQSSNAEDLSHWRKGALTPCLLYKSDEEI